MIISKKKIEEIVEKEKERSTEYDLSVYKTARNALQEYEKRAATGEKLIFVKLGNDVFVMNKVYEDSIDF